MEAQQFVCLCCVSGPVFNVECRGEGMEGG